MATIRDKLAKLMAERPKGSPATQAGRAQAARRAYAAKKLTDIIEDLVDGEGDARSRLLKASFSFPGINRDDFPEDLRPLWDQVKATANRFEPFWESPARPGEMFRMSDKNATWGMRNSTAAKANKALWRLYWAVTKNRRYR